MVLYISSLNIYFQISYFLVRDVDLCKSKTKCFKSRNRCLIGKLVWKSSEIHTTSIEYFSGKTCSTHCKKKKFSIKDLFGKFDQIRRKLRIQSHSQKTSLMENFIFCNPAVCSVTTTEPSHRHFPFNFGTIFLNSSVAEHL